MQPPRSPQQRLSAWQRSALLGTLDGRVQSASAVRPRPRVGREIVPVETCNSLPIDFDTAGSTLGAGWTELGGTFARASGLAYVATKTTPVNIFNIARYNQGAADVDITFTYERNNTNGYGCFYFGYDPTAGTGFRFMYDGGLSNAEVRTITDWQTGAGHGSRIGLTLNVVGGLQSKVRVQYVSATGVITITEDGQASQVRTASSPLTGTWIGVGMSASLLDNLDKWGPCS